MGKMLEVIADDARSVSQVVWPYSSGIARGFVTPFRLASGAKWMSDDFARQDGELPLEASRSVGLPEDPLSIDRLILRNQYMTRGVTQGVTTALVGFALLYAATQDGRVAAVAAATNAADYLMGAYRRSREREPQQD